MAETAGLGRIEKADRREAWPHEAADFTPWLGDHVSERAPPWDWNSNCNPAKPQSGHCHWICWLATPEPTAR